MCVDTYLYIPTARVFFLVGLPMECRGAGGVWGLGNAPWTRAWVKTAGVVGLSIEEGGGVDRAPWLDPPQKGLNWRDPQNPNETDPRALEVTQTQKSAKNANGIFGIRPLRGLRKIIICHIFDEKNFGQFLMLKNILGTFGAGVRNN